jgi:cysteinyl-tRNA synthetase
MDLKFPHHECEIAQNVGAHGHEPVRYWMHGNMLTVNGRKMAKSEGNGFTPEELITGSHKLLDKGYSPMTVRFFMLQGHYASTLDFSNEALQAAERGFKRMTAAMENFGKLPASASSDENILDWVKQCYVAMNDDFNTPVLISNLFEGVRIINSVKEGHLKLTQADIDLLTETFVAFFDQVLGLTIEASAGNNELTEQLMQFIIRLRANAKANKDFATSDMIRDELGKIKIQIKDTKEGSTWAITE